ncbi:pyridoxal phosphate-dependent aminotransferase [Pontibacter silvestris]|uniref:Aminotransferase n=1 Tax=Pontibacter silvestris TaxID=2305183 RepID=A0ABW4WRW1_9BACT|nr:aminotransferase class I/II-fold pyridoxal phosphate-dependent enzyme [Pontibacter silvestris]MCC9136134.1 aminotransferase class I/II-fold pyridoxal phosphate-dependent enzyme [Pontibacter silvestris]
MIIPKAERLSHVQEYYFAKKLAEVSALNAKGKNVINLGIGSPDMPPSPATIDAMTSSAAQNAGHGYQPYRSLPALRQAIADWYTSTFHVNLNPDTEVLPLMGSKEGIFHISMAFLNPGDKVLVPNPGYPAYATTARLAGAEPVYYTLSEENNWLPDMEQLEDLASQGVKLMWINYPHMPTGVQATKEALEQLSKLARKYKFLLINDNPYSLVLPTAAPRSLLTVPDAMDCCLELNSLSKSHNMAGWRVGMLLGRQDYISTVLAVKSNIDSGMFQALQHAAIEALHNPDEWHQQRNQEYAKRRQLVHKLLDILECNYQKDSVGMFVWAKVPEHVSDVEVYLDELLYEAGVFLTPGKVFGTQGERFLRVSLCVSVPQIEESIKRIKQHTLNTVSHELK